MATYAELFGGNNWVKFSEDGEEKAWTFVSLEQVPQENFKTKKAVFLVQQDEGGPWARKDEGDFDPDTAHRVSALKKIRLHLLDGDGKDWVWDLPQKAEESFKNELKRVGKIDEGDTVGGKLLDKEARPQLFKTKIIPAK